MNEHFEIAIAGGGIVGLATALALSEQREGPIVVLEAEGKLAAHQSGHNSGVIHSGLYYRPGSLKAKLCTEGREALYRFCADHGVKHERCGKIVVATAEEELPRLEELRRRGEENGLSGMESLTPEQIREHEPHAAGIAGLFVPQTGIVDFGDVVRAYAGLLEDRGVRVMLGAPLTSARQDGDHVVVETPVTNFRCAHLVTCAGLQADRVARRCGARPQVRIVPFRGEYDELVPEARRLVQNLIYPVPDPRFPFLGVHFTRMTDGEVEVGPNAVLALSRHGYRGEPASLGDVFDMLRYRGFWMMGIKNWRTGMAERRRSRNARIMLRHMRRLVPELTADDIRPGRSGVRAMAVDPSGRMLDDFSIMREGRMVHVLNAPSPAATASLAIGKFIARMVDEADQS